jgi:hypothetical protein
MINEKAIKENLRLGEGDQVLIAIVAEIGGYSSMHFYSREGENLRLEGSLMRGKGTSIKPTKRFIDYIKPRLGTIKQRLISVK